MLTNVTVTQAVDGKYDIVEGEMTADGRSVVIPDLLPGESYSFTYRVPANIAQNFEVINSAEVTTAQEVSDKDECTVFVKVTEVDITIVLDKPVYGEDETVVYTETVTNTGSVPLTHIAVNQALFGEYEVKEGEMTVKGTEVIIPDLQPDESYTFTYSVPASYAEQGKLKNTAT